MRALDVGGVLTLARDDGPWILPLGPEEEDEPGRRQTARTGIKRGSESSVEVADAMLDFINEIDAGGMALKYNKHYIGLARDGLADNFIQFRARKEHLIAEFRIPRARRGDGPSWSDSGLDSLDVRQAMGTLPHATHRK